MNKLKNNNPFKLLIYTLFFITCSVGFILGYVLLDMYEAGIFQGRSESELQAELEADYQSEMLTNCMNRGAEYIRNTLDISYSDDEWGDYEYDPDALQKKDMNHDNVADYKDAWDKAEFEDALKKLKDSGVEWPIYVRQNKPSTEYYTWMPFVASFGGDYMNRETGLCTGTLDGDNTIASFDFLAKLFTDGYADATCDYEDSFQKGENALALYGHSKYQDYKAALGDDLILVPLPDMGHGVYTCSGSTVMIMTTGAQESGKDDAVWAMLQEATNPDYIKMVVDVNGAVPARSSVMDAIPDYCEGGTLYLYRQQLESGISCLRPYTPAHMTIYDAMASVIGNIYAGADPATELHDAAANIDEIITENGWNFQ